MLFHPSTIRNEPAFKDKSSESALGGVLDFEKAWEQMTFEQRLLDEYHKYAQQQWRKQWDPASLKEKTVA